MKTVIAKEWAKAILYSPKDNTVAILSHNLTLAEAKREVRRLRSTGLPAFYSLQKRVHGHGNPEVDRCSVCSREITQSMERI
jgi:hypothetical protein